MDMYEAFRQASGSIVAVVGGGGKSGLLFRLAAQAAARGETVIVTTTTRLHPPAEPPLLRVIEAPVADLPEAVRAALRPGEPLIAATGHLEDGRLLGFDRLALAPMVLLEPGMIAVAADGAVGRAFKAPAVHEPAVPPEATDVVVCVGLDILGKPLTAEFVHRPEMVVVLSGANLGDPITADIITQVLLHKEGGRKNVPEAARVHALLHAPLHSPMTKEHEKLAVHIAQRLVFGGYCRGVVGDTSAGGEVLAVVQ